MWAKRRGGRVNTFADPRARSTLIPPPSSLHPHRSTLIPHPFTLIPSPSTDGRVRIRFCPEARSGELPPATFVALYRQRLRWALGWDQVTIRHFRFIHRFLPSRTVTYRHVPSRTVTCRHVPSRTVTYRHIPSLAVPRNQVTIQHFRSIGSADLSCREKAALYWILPMRWLLVFSAT